MNQKLYLDFPKGANFCSLLALPIQNFCWSCSISFGERHNFVTVCFFTKYSSHSFLWIPQCQKRVSKKRLHFIK